MPDDTVSAAATGLPDETRDIGDAIDLLCRAIRLNELIFMASESIAKEAITTGCDMLDIMLEEVKAVLYANIERNGGGA